MGRWTHARGHFKTTHPAIVRGLLVVDEVNSSFGVQLLHRVSKTEHHIASSNVNQCQRKYSCSNDRTAQRTTILCNLSIILLNVYY